MNTEHDYERDPYPTNPEDDRLLRALVLIVIGVVALFMFTGA